MVGVAAEDIEDIEDFEDIEDIEDIDRVEAAYIACLGHSNFILGEGSIVVGLKDYKLGLKNYKPVVVFEDNFEVLYQGTNYFHHSTYFFVDTFF